MIRINLLPRARTAPAGGSSLWLGVYAGAIVLWCVVLGVFYFLTDAELQEQLRANRTLAQQVQTMKQKSAKLEELEARLQRSKQLEALVDELNRARTGPTRVLYELSRILSQGGGPTIDVQRLEELRRDNPLAGFNPNWDVRRLWLKAFQEEDRICRVTGEGKTNEDIAEFIRRLSLSDLFEQVALTKTAMTKHDKVDVELISFELTCKVRY